MTKEPQASPRGTEIQPSDSRVWSTRVLVICGLLLLASAINYLDRQTLASASARIMSEFGLSNEQYGDIEAAFGYGFVLGSIVFGFRLTASHHAVAVKVRSSCQFAHKHSTSLVNRIVPVLLGSLGWGRRRWLGLLKAAQGGRDIDKVNAVSEIMAPHLHAVPAEFAWQPLSVSQSSLSQWFRVLT